MSGPHRSSPLPLSLSLLALTVLPVAAARFNGTANGDGFGMAAAVIGGVDGPAVVGAPRHHQNGVADRGAVHLYRYSSSQTGVIAQTARLIASDGTADDLLGTSVSLSGINVLAGAPGDGTGGINTNLGAAYLWREIATASGTVNHSVKLVATTASAGDALGTSVALDGTTAIAGNPGINFFGTLDQGAVYLFRNLDTATGTINESSILYDSTGAANDRLGSAVAMWQGTAAAGAPRDDVGLNADQGSVCYFRNLATAGAVLTQAVKLTAADGVAGDQLGAAVGLSGNAVTGMRHLVAGAPGDDAPGAVQSGSAYLYRIITTATGTLTQNAKLTASGAAENDNFGASVSVSGTNALVGAPGTDKPGFACLFQNLGTATGPVTETVRLWPTAGTVDDRFGSAVAIDNDHLVIGAERGTGTVAGSGAAWTGSVRLLTTTNTGGTVEQIGFRSRTNWVIGDTTGNVVVTLAADASAELAAAATAIHVGRTPSADNCRLVVAGTIVNAPSIFVGDSTNTGNELRVTGIADAAAVRIERDSILSGTGTVTGNVSITGSLRPGVSSRGNLNVGGDLTWLAGNAWQFDLAAGNLSDTLTIQGASSDFLKGTGTAARTFDFLGSSQPGTYTLVTWGGTTNFTAADFAATNVGGGLAATFAIAGKSLTVTIGSSLTPLEQWRQTHFGSSASTGNGADAFDADRDGLPNLVEYALGTTPTSAASSAEVIVGQSGGRLTLRFTPQIVAGLTYSVQTSANLATWTTTDLAGLAAGSPFTWTDTVAFTAGQRRYVRLRVSY